MTNKILLITGANTGLGYETVKALCKSPVSYTILLGGRSLEKANSAVQEARELFPQSTSELEAVQIDLEDDDSIERLFDQVSKKYGRLDILINNGGASFDQTFQAGTMTMRQMWNKSWDVNTTGTHILTHTFVPLILKSTDARILFITSGISTLTEHDNTAVHMNKSPAKGWPKPFYGLAAYRATKTGLNMMMLEWVRLLKEDGVKIWSVSPGFLATGLGNGPDANKKLGAQDPAIGANFIRDVVEGARDEDVGKAIRLDNVQPW